LWGNVNKYWDYFLLGFVRAVDGGVLIYATFGFLGLPAR
jgi:hypothetical protein